MPMLLAMNIWMTVSQRMVSDWSRLDRHAPQPAQPADTAALTENR